MAQRKTTEAGDPIAFTCRNRRFETLDEGYLHRPGDTHRGSVFPDPLFANELGTLFLEHVFDTRNPEDELYWLMWYDQHGNPQLGASSVFGPGEVVEIGRQLVDGFRSRPRQA